MATQKQVFTEAHENIDKANHTTGGLIEYLRYIFGKLENASGGGGGDTVTWSQKVLSGTEIAEIDISGDKTKVYIPDKIQIVTGTLSSTLNDPVNISYPTGFDNTNCLIIGAMFDRGNNAWSEQTVNNKTRFDASITSVGITVIPRNDDAKSTTVKIVLLKIS